MKKYIFIATQQDEAQLDPFNISIVVRACTSLGSHTFGRMIHAAVIKHGFQSSRPVMNSLLDMYCRCDCLPEARKFFNELSEKDLITWNTLIAAYEKSDSREALDIFSRMESEGLSPNCFTLTSVTAACANLAILNCGQQVHGGIIRRGLERNLELCNALIDMYAKCGDITEALKIFSNMPYRNLVSWTSMMKGYGTHGYGKEAVELFDEMVRSGIRPDRVVFMAVLNACSHAGLVDEGLRYFNAMVDHYKVSPDQEIYGCVVDLLGRAGRVEEAYQLVETMPFKPDESVWGALLGACKAHKLTNLANKVACRALESEPKRVGTYQMLANIYAAEGKWGEYARVRKMMKGMGSRKEAGRSWIEVKDQVYSFVVGDKTGSDVEWLYNVLELLVWHMNEAGYVPDYDSFMEDLDGKT